MRALLLCLLLILPVGGLAQTTDQTSDQTTEPTSPALLVADSVLIEGEDRLIATGNVEALQDGIRLEASRITYDRATDRLEIDGPIRITDPDGTVVTADSASLDQGLRDGLLVGARMVLDQQLQLASVEAQRVGGRYTQLSKVAVTSCQVCGDEGTPLWQIRARRVIHDQQERQLYFDQATLRVLDVPVFYLPRLRLPDPTLKRARGFLLPSLRSSTLLGFGIKLPYFIPIGDHQDLTLTPYLSPKTRTLEYRYRRAFVAGEIEVNGSVSSDTLRADDLRSYVNLAGRFDLPREIELRFDLTTVSDNAYINDYDLPGGDRPASTVQLTRFNRDGYLEADLVYYEILRASEDDETQPSVMGDLRWGRRWFPARLPGEVRLDIEAHGHRRVSDRDNDGPDADTEVDGRDVARINADLGWQNRWTLPLGLRAGASARLWLDHYETRQDVTSRSSVSRATPAASVELRWPFARQGALGGQTLLEPMLALGWVGGSRGQNPNDESTRVEFDEANLLSLSRYPAPDRREHGATLAAGLRWMHRAPQGWSAALTMGRLWRDSPDPEFSRSSGLDDTASDWLIAARFANATGLSLNARGLLDDKARFSKAEARAGWSNARLDLGASYVLLVIDPDENRSRAVSEWTLDAAYRVSRHWTSSTDIRYDLSGQRMDRVGFGLTYTNECVEVEFGASRRFASATNLEPSTNFDLTVALKGFSTGGSAKEYRRTCTQ